MYFGTSLLGYVPPNFKFGNQQPDQPNKPDPDTTPAMTPERRFYEEALDAFRRSDPERQARLEEELEAARQLIRPEDPEKQAANSELRDAIRFNDLPQLEQALRLGADTIEGLWFTAKRPPEFLKTLLAHPQITDNPGFQKALHQTLRHALLEQNAEVVDLIANSPLFIVLPSSILEFSYEMHQNGVMPPQNRQIFEMLLAQPGVDVNKTHPKNGWTALHRAVWTGNLEAFKVLLAQPGIRTDLKTTPQEKPGLTVAQMIDARLQKLLLQRDSKETRRKPQRLPGIQQGIENYQQMGSLLLQRQ